MRHLSTIVVLLFLLPGSLIQAQDDLGEKQMSINGHIVTAYIDECGDTVILAELDDVSITSIRDFESREDRIKYNRYRRYAVNVYPYATEAIRIFRELEEDTKDMKRRKRKKHIRRLNKELKEEFEDPLRKLTKTQGYILFKMIERELDTPMYQLLKNLRGGFNATYWNTIGYLNGYHLKDGYIRGEDPILDAVLDDFDISYDL